MSKRVNQRAADPVTDPVAARPLAPGSDPGGPVIAFSCPHCGAHLTVRDSMAGTAGPCPSCSRVVRAPAAPGGQPTLPPPAGAEDTAPSLPGLAPPDDYPFLAPPQGPDELGRLGPYRVLSVLGKGA